MSIKSNWWVLAMWSRISFSSSNELSQNRQKNVCTGSFQSSISHSASNKSLSFSSFSVLISFHTLLYSWIVYVSILWQTKFLIKTGGCQLWIFCYEAGWKASFIPKKNESYTKVITSAYAQYKHTHFFQF
jgi:hypothetical protein